MNVANLQLEGLYMAVAAVNDLLVEKGFISREELARALSEAEAAASSGRSANLSSAEQDAVRFAPRLLVLANRAEAGTSFSDLARQVGQQKDELSGI